MMIIATSVLVKSRRNVKITFLRTVEEDCICSRLIANDSKLHFVHSDVFLLSSFTVPQVVLPLDVQNLYVLQEIVLSRKYAHIVYMYIPPLRIRHMEETFFLQYYMLGMIFTFLVPIL